MNITRRNFLKHCTVSAGALSLTPLALQRLEAALTSRTAPTTPAGSMPTAISPHRWT
ncbi:MAG: twin-arginine translocation signal domain-containing protein [Phycisphaerales bacterium]|nr:MAG: twin-arginine translocation signal domain-containing protein [Phycisphaerales bacterium]